MMAGFLEQALTGSVGTLFLVFPDCDAVTPLAQRVRAVATHHYAHASGRPWLVGRWADDECVVVGDHDRRLAVIGSFPPGDTVRAWWQAWSGAAGTDRLAESMAESLPGSFHLVTSAGGEVTVAGTASGVRLVFSARVGSVTVAASRADVLARLLGAGVDETQVAVRLLSVVPHPLPLASMWRGVRTVEPGSRLRLGRDGSERTAVWWTPPVPHEPFSVGALQVQAALSDAVDARTAAGGMVTCDLFGGVESTAMCLLAAHGPARVIARIPSSPDLARLVAVSVPEIEHVAMPGEETVAEDRGTDMMDEPTMAMMSRAELERFYLPLAGWGSRVHLAGWWAPSAEPMVAAMRLRGIRALPHWADRRRYHLWLLKSAYQLTLPAQRPDWTLGWSAPPQLPEWVTPAAATAVRKTMIRAAATAEPIAPGRGAHAELSAIRQGGRWLRQVEQVCAVAGLPTASPFFDDRVVRACLSVRPEDRSSPERFRPVLRAALSDLVPPECLQRAARDVVPAAALRRPDPLSLWDGSCLATMGIVDEKRLRALAPARRDGLDLAASVELWLRSLRR